MLGSGKLDYGMAVEACYGRAGFGVAVQVRSVKAWSGLSSSGWARRSGHGEARRSMSGRSS